VTAGVLLRIDKGIPVAGGMAGGSADAAGALVACDALWRTGLDRSELLEIAASLGSDVPFALAGGTALATGRGDLVAPVLARGQFHWVFALAERGLSTAAVYAEYDRGDPVPERPTDAVLGALRTGDAAALGRALHNDLQPPALRTAAGAAPGAGRRTRTWRNRRGRLGQRADLRLPHPVGQRRDRSGGVAGRRRRVPVGPPRLRPGRRRADRRPDA
jgi:4-diphosphocytidyl-2C-methyl-D-erythritol kinase